MGIGYENWKRNLAVALEISDAGQAMVHTLQDRMPCASAMVGEHIDRALTRLRGPAVSGA